MSDHITLPKGFVAAGVRCGIKSTGEDLAIIAVEGGEVPAAVVLTRNQVFGAPIAWARSILPKGCGRLRAMVINSGCSNVCTGRKGLRDAESMALRAARKLGTVKEKVLVASTGVIGRRLPMDKVRAGIDDAAGALGADNDPAVVRAIMTTDTRAKSAVARAQIDGEEVTVAGIVKGAGMIAPSMATMIGVLTTDAKISPRALGKALRGAVAGSFNAITVDSDTSTSDTVAIFASGAAGNRSLGPRSEGWPVFVEAMKEVCGALAYAVVADGEGATKVIHAALRGAASDSDAEIAAKSIANSPLLKCAVNGGDPNWGRIVMALGKSEATVDPESLSVRIGGVCVFSGGRPRNFDVAKVEKHMAGHDVEIDADLGLGEGRFTALTCDLSHEYVTINADYHT